MSADEELPYEGLRVVDLSQGVAGPHCGMLFALYGADVVKVALHRIPGLAQPAPGSATAHSPVIGEHTREVLGEIGLAPAEIGALEAAGVVRASQSGKESP